MPVIETLLFIFLGVVLVLIVVRDYRPRKRLNYWKKYDDYKW